MPFPIGLAIGLQAAGAGLNIMEQQKARREAKKAQKKQQRQDALFNLMSVIGGQGPIRPTPVQSIPQVNIGGAVSGLGGTLGQLSMNQQAAAANQAQMAKTEAFRNAQLAIQQQNANTNFLRMLGEDGRRGTRASRTPKAPVRFDELNLF